MSRREQGKDPNLVALQKPSLPLPHYISTVNLQKARTAVEAANELQALSVAQARRAGMTWQEIAGALGITRQAAHHRYS